jgi:hypothetical protein
MALYDQAQLASDGVFRARVQVALVAAALQVVGEDSTTPSSYERQVLGVKVLTDPDVMTPRFAWAVAANPAVTADSADDDIAYTITTVWDDVAGVLTAEKPA